MDEFDDHAPLKDLRQKPVRLRPALIKQIDELRRERGQTFQSFVHAAIVKALAEGKEELENNKKKREPKGLGIREQLEAAEENAAVPAEPELRDSRPVAAPQAPVTVNVNTGGAAGGDLTTLARMVVGAPHHSRRDMLHTAVQALAKNAKNADEAVSLAEQLDAEIKRLDKPTTFLEQVRARRKK